MLKRKTTAVFLAAILVLAACSHVKYRSAGATPAAVEYSLGYLKVNYNNPVIDIYRATLSAYKDLGIPVTQGKADSLTGKVEGKLADGTEATTDLKALTENLTAISIKVGAAGNKDFSYRINEQIKKHL